jgi:SAM-dependent methyltransferase
MHYKLPNGIVIKSENAAKPDVQASKPLSDYISHLEAVGSSFDYGCGKLRYTDVILSTTDALTAVDSEVQISRTQVVHGDVTTIRNIARRSNRLTAVNVTEFPSGRAEFDRGFCLNVLSVIPFFSVRRRVLSVIRQRLRAGGTCVFVVQYRNSDFSRMSRLANAQPWRDGFLINSLRGFSFYALISPQRLATLVRNAGFQVIDQVLDNGRIFLMARSPSKPATEVAVVKETNFRTSVKQKRLSRPSRPGAPVHLDR